MPVSKIHVEILPMLQIYNKTIVKSNQENKRMTQYRFEIRKSKFWEHKRIKFNYTNY